MTTSYTVPDGPKMLRETLCVAQAVIIHDMPHAERKLEHLNRLQRLIDECDRHRPIGPNGKHGDWHTTTCGCDDVPGSALTPVELADRQERQQGEKPCSNPSCPLRYAHRGPCAPPGPQQQYGAETLLNLADEAQHMADQGIEPLLNTTLARMLRLRAQLLVAVTPEHHFPFGMR